MLVVAGEGVGRREEDSAGMAGRTCIRGSGSERGEEGGGGEGGGGGGGGGEGEAGGGGGAEGASFSDHYHATQVVSGLSE